MKVEIDNYTVVVKPSTSSWYKHEVYEDDDILVFSFWDKKVWSKCDLEILVRGLKKVYEFGISVGKKEKTEELRKVLGIT